MSKKFMAMALAAIGFVSVASAQSDSSRIDATPSFLTVRGGVLFPLDDGLRDASDFWGVIGVDYEFPTQLIRGSTTFLTGEWWLRTSSGDNGNVFPITINQKFYTKGGNRYYPEGRNYFFLGVGVAIIDVSGESSGKWMLRGGVGTELGPNILVEAAASFSDASRTGARANGIGVSFGYRF